MGLNRIRKDSVKDRRKQKSVAELQKENEQLKDQVQSLETQLEEQADALIELAAMIDGEV